MPQPKPNSKGVIIQGKREVDTIMEGLKTPTFFILLALTAFASCKFVIWLLILIINFSLWFNDFQ